MLAVGGITERPYFAIFGQGAKRDLDLFASSAFPTQSQSFLPFEIAQILSIFHKNIVRCNSLGLDFSTRVKLAGRLEF